MRRNTLLFCFGSVVLLGISFLSNPVHAQEKMLAGLHVSQEVQDSISQEVQDSTPLANLVNLLEANNQGLVASLNGRSRSGLMLIPTVEYVNVHEESLRKINIYRYSVDVLVNVYLGKLGDTAGNSGKGGEHREFEVANIIPNAAIKVFEYGRRIDAKERDRIILTTLKETLELAKRRVAQNKDKFSAGRSYVTFGYIEKATFNPDKKGVLIVKNFDRQFPPILAATIMEQSKDGYANVGYFRSLKDTKEKPDGWNRRVINSVNNRADSGTAQYSGIVLIFREPQILFEVNISGGGTMEITEKRTNSKALFVHKYWVRVIIHPLDDFFKKAIIKLSEGISIVTPRSSPEAISKKLVAHNLITKILTRMPEKIFENLGKY